MTRFRYWLADLISGGELTRLSMSLDRERDYAATGWKLSKNFARQYETHRLALRQIAAEAKPTSNATVKRIARIAHEALNHAR